ncbi:MAG: hypothetical protein NTY19_20125 [Planctomycetota bacterium]|nr:hypothetical protein [Planctomycetota bacterium]
MQELIENLDDATAIRVLRTFSTARSRHGDYQTEWSPELRQAFAEGVAAADVTAAVRDGDLAREALLLLAGDPDNHPPLTALIDGPPPQRFLDPTTIAIGVAALIALQTHVKFERTKDGKIYFKIEKQPLPVGLMQKLIAFFSQRSP